MIEKRYPQTILATVCIPWTESFEFDERLFRRQVRKLVKRDVTHIYLFGTAGEGYAVTDRQFDDIVRVFSDEMKGPGLHPMTGLISLSFPAIMERLKKAYGYGIRDFQFSLPSWGVLSDDELFSFLHKLCDPYPYCRFLHYNNIRSKRLLDINEYEKLAEEIPNFAGVKYSTSDMVAILNLANSSCPLRFFLTENGFGYGSMFGDFGYLISISNININRAWEYFNAGIQRDRKKLMEIQNELFQILKKLLEIVGSGKIDGAYDKMFSKVLDSEFPLRLLPPYVGSDDEKFRQFKFFLEKKFPQWLER